MQKNKIYYLIVLIATYFVLLGSANAASLSLSKSSSNVSVGSTVKITAKISGGSSYTYSNFSVSYDQDIFSFVSSGDNCNGLNCLIEGNGSVTLTFKAKGEGSGTFSASGTFEDDNSGNISSSTKVTVGAKTESKNLKSNNNLASLSIEGYELKPQFSKDTLEYSLDVESSVTTLNIKAEAEDNTAKIVGAGEVKVSEGVNTLNIEVTAENGSKKTYVIKVNVDEKNPLKTKKENLTIVRNLESVEKPENYELKTIKIDNQEVQAFYSEITNFTLVGLKDEKGNIKLYVYDQKKEDFTLYQEVQTSGIKFYPIEPKKEIKNYKLYDIDMNGAKIKGYKLNKDSKYAIIYGMDLETGEENFYMYDLKNNTLQLYNDEHVKLLTKQNNIYTIVILSSWGLLGISFIIILALCNKNSKRKKKIRIILEKLSKEENEEPEEDIIDEEKIVDEVLKDEEEMYNIMDED